jgi:hypothetical protein
MGHRLETPHLAQNMVFFRTRLTFGPGKRVTRAGKIGSGTNDRKALNVVLRKVVTRSV